MILSVNIHSQAIGWPFPLAIHLPIPNNIRMAKSPFEKVRSLVERKKLFIALLAERSEVVCKGEGEELFVFQPTEIVSESLLQGHMTSVDKIPDKDMEIIGNFSVAGEKYFFTSQFKIMPLQGAIFHLSCDVFKLQRRGSLRLHIPSSLGIHLAITEFSGKAIYSVAQIADVSAGGARIFFSDLASPVPLANNSKTPELRPADKFKAILHLGTKRSLEVKAEVKHVQQAVHLGHIVDHIGIEFIESTQALRNRLLAMTMDVQQRMTALDR